MNSLFMKSVYTGLGLLGSGRESLEQLGKKLAKQADLSEKDGQRIARELRTRTEKAITSAQKSLESEVGRIIRAVQAATKEMAASEKKPSKRRGRKRH